MAVQRCYMSCFVCDQADTMPASALLSWKTGEGTAVCTALLHACSGGPCKAEVHFAAGGAAAAPLACTGSWPWLLISSMNHMQRPELTSPTAAGVAAATDLLRSMLAAA